MNNDFLLVTISVTMTILKNCILIHYIVKQLATVLVAVVIGGQSGFFGRSGDSVTDVGTFASSSKRIGL